jgi:Ca2+-binding RTX toxin-like protein
LLLLNITAAEIGVPPRTHTNLRSFKKFTSKLLEILLTQRNGLGEGPEMKSEAFPNASRFGRAVTILSSLILLNALTYFSVAQGSDSDLNLTISRINQNAVLSWFGSNMVPYQVETSSNLTVWSNSSPVLSGNGSSLFITNPIAPQSRSFYRVKRMGGPWSANFDPVTGILTIIGNEVDNVIIVSRDAAGVLRINGGVVNITGGIPTVANTTLIQIFGRGGNDQLSLDETNGALPKAQLFGEDGNDALTGGSAADVLNGGPGNDTFVWNPGGGNDVLEGQAGTDKLLFNGSNATENMDVSANGTRLRFFRDVGSVTLDCDDVENVQVNSFGGADILTINELTSTDVKDLLVDLAATGGGGDAQADSIFVSGTQTNDSIVVSGSSGALMVTGLSAKVTITNSEPANDSLTINAVGGLDVVDASALAGNAIKLTINGGLGDDTLRGSQGGDLLNAGDGFDLVFGNGGDDTFVWNPGDDNDSFIGGSGIDTLQFNGANIIEHIDLSAVSGHLRFSRDVSNVTTDCDEVENVRFAALGGADVITINNLSGTDVTSVNINLASSSGTSDGAADNISIYGTVANDTVTVNGGSGTVNVLGLPELVTLTSSEGANDHLTIYTLGGDDSVDASGLPAGNISLTINGGNNNDVLIGSAGPDSLFGGDGDDVLIGGPGTDVLDGGLGSNSIIQD